MELRLHGRIWHWRGPAPHHFVSVKEGLEVGDEVSLTVRVDV